MKWLTARLRAAYICDAAFPRADLLEVRIYGVWMFFLYSFFVTCVV